MSSTSTSSSDVVSTSDSADTTRRAAGVALTALERIESGETHAALTVAQLCRPADTLALDPRLLLRSPTQPPAAGGENRPLPFTQDGSSGDVADLACLLLVAHATISRDLAARALGWTLTRLEATLARPQAEVPALGVELARHGHSIRLTRTGDWNRTIKLATLQRVDEVTRATKARTARLVRALLTGDPDAGTAPADAIAEAKPYKSYRVLSVFDKIA